MIKTIDPARLQSTVDAAAKGLMIPGAVVELRTPKGTFTAASGTTRRDTALPPGADMQQTSLPATTDPDPFSKGYMYDGSAFALVDLPYPPAMEAAAKAGILLIKVLDQIYSLPSQATPSAASTTR